MTDNVQIGTRELGAVANEGDNPEDFIGLFEFSLTGEALVPCDWLEEKWDEYNLPQSQLPRKPSNWSAYRRTIQALKDDAELRAYQVRHPEYSQTFDCELSIQKSNEHGTNVFLVYARTFFPEDIVDEEGGNWSETRVGHFDFYNDDGDLPGRLITEREIEPSNLHYEAASELFMQAREVENKMRSHYNFNDLQSILENHRFRTDAVEIRRSVYFVPAHHQETVDSLRAIWEQMNQFKDGGEEMRIDKTPVVDMQEQRELVADRVRDKVETMVDDIVNEIVSDFEDDDDETADAAARKLMNELSESDSGNVASTYNQLLNMRLSIKQVLEERRSELAEEAQEIIDNVLEQQKFDEIEV